MADNNETVSLAYTADMSDLLAQLEKLPGISKEEAAKMAKNIEKGMKDTEKAAKSASKANTKSMQKMQQSAKKTGKSFKNMKRGASEMGRGLAELTLLVGDQDSALGQMMAQTAGAGLALGAIAPVFGVAKTGLVGLGVSAGIATGGLTILAGGTALLLSKMMSAGEETAAQKKKVEKLAAEHKKLAKELEASIKKNDSFTKSIEKSEAAIDAFIRATDEELLSLMFERGELSIDLYMAKLDDLNRQKAFEKVGGDLDAIEKTLQNQIMHYKEQLAIQKKLTEEYAPLLGLRTKDTNIILTSLRDIDNISEKVKSNSKGGFFDNLIGNEAIKQLQTYKNIQDDLLTAESDLRGFEKNREQTSKRILENSNNLLDRKKEDLTISLKTEESDKRKAKAAERQARIDEAKAANAAILENILAQISKSQEKTAQMGIEELNNKISETKEVAKLVPLLEAKRDIEIANLEAGKTALDLQKTTAEQSAKNNEQKAAAALLAVQLSKEEAEIDTQIQRAKKEAQQEIDQLIAGGENLKAANFDLEKMRLSELYELEMTLRGAASEDAKAKHEMVMQQIQQREKLQRDGMKQLMSNTESFFGARIQLMQDSGKAEQDSITKLFYMQQAAAAAQVAIATAENIVTAQKYGPILSPLLTASYVGLAGAQIGAIMGQNPPTARHMGGMANDESNYKLLSGEAVLSRQAVRSVGGEQGLKRMERGAKGGGDVIILQPFKHFDRYLNQRSKRKAQKASNGGY